MHDMKPGQLLATMALYARAGQEAAVYNGATADQQMLIRRGMRSYTIFRGPGGTQPAVLWTITFSDWNAHDAWAKAYNNMHKTAAELAADKRMDGATARTEHRHYILHDGWWEDECP